MSTATVELVDLAQLVGDITPKCECLLYRFNYAPCRRPAHWLLVCPCGDASFACTGCREDIESRPEDWSCETCGSGPAEWAWRAA